MNKLFEPLHLGTITLPNRILMAPVTRAVPLKIMYSVI